MTSMLSPVHAPCSSIRSLWRAPRHSAQGPHQPIMSICTKLQNKEPVIEALCRAKFKFPGYQRATSLRSGDLLSITGMNLKAWFQMFFCFSTEQLFFLKSSLSQMAVGGSNTSLIVAPWINGGSWKHDSLGGVPSLLMPTSKFKFPVKKKCPLNSRPES